MNAAVGNAVAWLEAQVRGLRFGEATIKLVIHEGRVSRVEKTISEKEQPCVGRDHAEQS